MRKIICLISFLCCTSFIYGQSNYSVGALPQINVGFKVSKSLRINQKAEFRQYFSEGHFSDDVSLNSHYGLIQSETVLNRALDANKFFGLGYLLRYEDQGFTHRFIQQYLTSKKHNTFILNNRYRLEETFSDRNSVEWRLRYRIGAEVPLKGHTLEAKEFYLRLNTEFIPSIRSNKTNLEGRSFFALGDYLNEHNRLELGLDYRASNLLYPYTQHQFWLNINWAVNL